jgi:hypothetical protein
MNPDPAVTGDLLRIHRGWLRRKAGEIRAGFVRHGFANRCAVRKLRILALSPG